MRDIAIFFETSLFVLSKTYLAWKMSDYAVHFGLPAQSKQRTRNYMLLLTVL